MAASPNLLPWFETARIAAKCTQAAPAMTRLLTMRPSVLERDTHLRSAHELTVRQFQFIVARVSKDEAD
jgi:hypothetical protein